MRNGRDALGYYHEKKDEARDVGLGPEHDWSSHAADAFGLMAIAYEELSRKARFNRPINYPQLGLFEMLVRQVQPPDTTVQTCCSAEATRQDKGPYLAEAAPTFAAGLVKVIGASMSPSVVLSNAERLA
jgi:hypothetical protein